MAREDGAAMIRQLIADALVRVEDGPLRRIVAELVRDVLSGYECQRIVQEAITPVVRETVAALLDDPLIREAFQGRVKQQFLAAAGGAELTFKTRY